MSDIRLAVVGEAAAARDMVQRAYAPWVPVCGMRPRPMDADYAALVAAGEVHLLLRNGAPLALIVLQDKPGHLWLDNVAVPPEAQGLGLGRELLDFAEAEARRRGHGEIRLLTNAKMLKNIGIYAARGYAETARVADGDRVAVYMAKPL